MNIIINPIFKRKVGIVLKVDYFGISSERFNEYKNIIMKLDGMSHTVSNDGRLEINFEISDVFYEAEPGKEYKSQ